MYRKIADHKRTATIHKGVITMMADDGWENLVDCRMTFASDAEAAGWLSREWEEFDPNADLKAKGFIWNGYCYVKPQS